MAPELAPNNFRAWPQNLATLGPKLRPGQRGIAMFYSMPFHFHFQIAILTFYAITTLINTLSIVSRAVSLPKSNSNHYLIKATLAISQGLLNYMYTYHVGIFIANDVGLYVLLSHQFPNIIYMPTFHLNYGITPSSMNRSRIHTVSHRLIPK